MKSLGIKVLLVLVALGGAAFALAGTADASHMKLDVVAPAELTVGHSANIQAVLHSTADGSAMAGVPVTFYTRVSFGDVTSEVELAKAVTDQSGMAVLSYEPRTAGNHEIRIEYLTPGASEPEQATWSHSVAGSTGQLYRSTAGVQIPGLNVWLLMAVVGVVWAILLSVALRVVAIARAGADVDAVSREAHRPTGANMRPAASHFDMTGGD